MKRNSGLAREGGQRLAAVPDKMVLSRNHARQRRSDRGVVVLRQNGVESRALPVAGDEDGNVVLIRTRMPGLSPRLRAFRGRSDQRPLNNSRIKVSSASTIPLNVRGLSSAGSRRTMPPAEGGGRMDAAQFSGLRQAHALDHRLGVIEPALLLAQMGHRRPGQGVERASAALAAEPQQPVRAAPADDLAAGTMGAALAFHPLNARRSKRVLAPAPLAAFARRSSCLRSAGLAIRLRQRLQGLTRCSTLIPPIADSQAEKS